MSEPTILDASHPAGSWAEVSVRGRVMRYRRSGAGRAILLLRAAAQEDPFWTSLAASLAERFRLIVPELAGCRADLVGWLGDFLDGIGTPRVLIVASDGCCVPAFARALLDPDRVPAVALLPDGELSVEVAAAAHEAGVALLVLEPDHPRDDLQAAVTAFVDRNAAIPRLDARLGAPYRVPSPVPHRSREDDTHGVAEHRTRRRAPDPAHPVRRP